MDTIPPQKRCSKCKQFKLATTDNFSGNRSRSDGLNVTCKLCKRADYRSKHPLTEKPVPEGYKRCVTCREDFLATSEHFHANKFHKDGLHSSCKGCRHNYHVLTHSPKGIIEGMKQCIGECGRLLPATSEYFPRANGNENSFRDDCKECRAKKVDAHLPTQREERSAQRKQYRQAHREEAAMYQKQWQQEHKEEVIIYRKERYQSHKEDICEQARQYQETHKEQVNARHNEYRRVHMEEYKARSRNRKALKRNSEGTHTAADIWAQYERQKGRCYYENCGHVKLGKGRGAFHADHVIPLSKGGSNSISNIVLTCPTCNLKKSTHLWRLC